MISNTSKKGTFKISIQPDSPAKDIEVAGDFSDWQPVKLRKGKDGAFSATVTLKPGRCEYKFLIDGRWMLDPDEEATVRNPYGTLNSVAVVK